MLHRIEIKTKDGIYDAIGESVRRDILDLNIKSIRDVSFIQVYLLEGPLDKKKLDYICKKLLCDPVTQEYIFDRSFPLPEDKKVHVVEVAYNPGVMDPVEESARKAIQDIGVTTVNSIRTAKRYIIKGNATKEEISFIVDKLLCNNVIQHITTKTESIPKPPTYKFKLLTIDLLNADDKELIFLSKNMQLYLSLEEMRAIKGYFLNLGRNPTDCELETIAQTWSEHCKHKTLRGIIEYEDMDSINGKKKIINNLLKNTIMKVTRELNKKWCISVFKDNSGIIKFDRRYNVCFKVETHNHPSAIEPYGGAGTGIGGVIRDPLGTGRGAKPILNTDVFCFGPPDISFKELPPGVLHPLRIMKGVVNGVRDYGNRMGIPTANGAVLFDRDFIGNPLVYCGNVGLIPKTRSTKRVDPGDLIVLVGGRTGRDGIHGATFSSSELTRESEVVSASAVQIGNPITEKKLTDTILQARDKNLYKAITDCGGGGLSSAVGEMGERTGVEVYLEKVPLKYSGLSYTEIWISEAQERMILAVEPKKVGLLMDIFKKEEVEAEVIGKFTDTKKLKLLYKRNIVAELDMCFLHHGLPKIKRKAIWQKQLYGEPAGSLSGNLTNMLLRLLSSWNICSKEWIIRQYDHEVQAGSVLKPLQGVNNDGPGDACVVRPILKSRKGIAVSNGINFLYGRIDPYWMAASTIDEALRQIISIGGALDRIALLDNFCWGNTDKPHQLGSLVRTALGCYDIAKGYGVPFISGKDSLNNEYNIGKKAISIPPTLLISAIGVIDDVNKVVSMDAKSAGNYIYVVGITRYEMGGSHYWKLRGYIGNSVPKVYPEYGTAVMRMVSKAISEGLIVSCHDLSEGGLGVALAEMAFAGGLGMRIDLRNMPKEDSVTDEDIALFSESNTRFIVEVQKEKKRTFEKFMKDVPIGLLGVLKKDSGFVIKGFDGKYTIKTTIGRLKKSWQEPFKNMQFRKRWRKR